MYLLINHTLVVEYPGCQSGCISIKDIKKIHVKPRVNAYSVVGKRHIPPENSHPPVLVGICKYIQNLIEITNKDIKHSFEGIYIFISVNF